MEGQDRKISLNGNSYRLHLKQIIKGNYDMRKCLRCQVEMIEDLVVMSSNGYNMDVRQKGIFQGSLGKIKGAVCPECGYIETYLEDVEKIKKLLENQ